MICSRGYLFLLEGQPILIYLTSDLHFGHDKDFMYGPRGFDSIEDHDRALIDKWNRTVSATDDVYVLGDLMLGDTVQGLQKLAQLNGVLHVVRGNHDTDNRWRYYGNVWNVIETKEAMTLKFQKFRFYLSHYPTLTANFDDGKELRRHLFNLCGHLHTKDKFADWDKGLIYHVELDAHDMRPVSIEQIIDDIREIYGSRDL